MTIFMFKQIHPALKSCTEISTQEDLYYSIRD